MGNLLKPIRKNKFFELVGGYDDRKLKGKQIASLLTRAGYGTPKTGTKFTEVNLSYWRKKFGMNRHRKVKRSARKRKHLKDKVFPTQKTNMNQIEEVMTCNLPDDLKLRFISNLINDK